MNNNLVFQISSVSANARASMKGQKPFVLWLTGLSGAGKTTVANAIEVALVERGRHTYLIDGDNVRMGLCRDLGFSDADREENIRRVAEVSRLFVDAGLIVITSFISPFERDRALARDVIGAETFIEVFIDAPLSECERRDPKGLYVKARKGLIKKFTGIDSIYEAPQAPDIHLNTLEDDVLTVVSNVMDYLDERTLV
ncbi:adenylyl-sulfate kinase [Pseudomonas fluorescens]|jgi:adenylylsulfate kinase|uniref:Adenylyl-sulfate kinase n=1 Tax=Pseudomonas fluorescens TaxID=294 RepID=A0A1B3DD75_PSEFL|nr:MULTISPECIES: adenylyl-sulfate kinase [Pseudomonas]AOE69497.1 adenylyl-sulfate kinase [Pseudomonas fluorescens]AOE75208.1 adenylyl-sulfate kinase [Pseudomonas fluorescens]QOU03682.1 adenylyl-sulfate kinase [Pseudomonas fluorescens]WEX14293.1 adenylyl-sulfate kinase [Pseudomonas sp. G11]WLD65984.1 adenylyl-sulfate kinase [Pseudomonas sp. OVF7]